MSITYSKCVSVALVNQHAKRMYRLTFSSVVCLTCHIFPQHFIIGKIFLKNIETKTCILNFFTNLPEIFLVLRKTERRTIIIVCWSSYKVSVTLVRF